MKRMLVLTCALVLAFSALAWGDVSISIYGHGSGDISIQEAVFTDFAQIYQSFDASGYYDFYSDLYVWDDWMLGGGDIMGQTGFLVDGDFGFYEEVCVGGYDWYGNWHDMCTYTAVGGEGFVIFNDFVHAGFDPMAMLQGSGVIDQEIYINGFLDGYVTVAHMGDSEWWWYIEQDYELNAFTPSSNSHVSQTAFLWMGDYNYFGTTVYLYDELFSIDAHIYDWSW